LPAAVVIIQVATIYNIWIAVAPSWAGSNKLGCEHIRDRRAKGEIAKVDLQRITPRRASSVVA